MPKHILALVFCLFLFTGALAQKGGLIYYLKNSGKLVLTKDSADYSMVVLPPDTSVDKNLYQVYEYYKDGKIMLITSSTTNDINLRYEGHYMAFADTVAEGKIDGGKEDGIWHLKKDDSIAVENEYNKGNLIYSKNIYKSGEIAFTKVDVNPGFPGGMIAFSRFIGLNMQYPPYARLHSIQGQVEVNFIVEKNGDVTNIKIVKGIGGGCDEAGVRAMELSPRWKPGLIGGIPVRVQYAVPLSFKLSE